MKKLISHRLSFLIALSAMVLLSFPVLALADSWPQKIHKFGHFCKLCGDMKAKDACGNQLIRSETNTIPISMHMQAGAGEWWQWPDAIRTIHSGVGYIEPFGKASYSCGIGYPEKADFPAPAYFTEDWYAAFPTSLFCVYTIEDGSGTIITYDGVMGNLKPSGWNGITGNKMDQLINVVVGGTGDYESATGMWVGHTEGWGEMIAVGDGSMTLPKSLFKIMDGYIKLKEE